MKHSTATLPNREQRLAKALRSNLRRRKQSVSSDNGNKEAGEGGDILSVKGGIRLVGEIPISGAKNAALPLLVASLLTDEEMYFDNIPKVSDVRILLELLNMLGCYCESIDGTWKLQAKNIEQTTAPYEIVSKMRAGFWVIAPLLARCGQACVSLPGGCAIGARPVDLYIKALEAMGAEISLEEGYIHANARNGLSGAYIHLPFVSVGATHVIAMAASLAKGRTILKNAAREPEVVTLLECLKKMGANIKGIGTSRITIEGVGGLLHGTNHIAPPDRIEAGTYAIAVAITGGEAILRGIGIDMLQSLRDVLVAAGVDITESAKGVLVARHTPRCSAVSIETSPYPGFPTDLQAQFMAMMCLADGKTTITETIFENRFMHVPELIRMGANINLRRDKAVVHGLPELTGASVKATDLRASVCLVLAGLAAQGETRVRHIHHLDRGFENIEDKLSACGANIQRLKETFT